jgi:hypothetical protein
VKKGWFDKHDAHDEITRSMAEEWFSFGGTLAVHAAGLLNNKEFIPLLASLLDRDDDVLLEEVSMALSRYQVDETVDAVLPYAKNRDYFIYAVGVLKEVKTNSAVNALVKCYEVLDEDGKAMVIEALLSQLSERNVHLINDFVNKGYRTDLVDTEEIFYSYFRLMNMSHPLLDQWKKVAEVKHANFRRLMEEEDDIFGFLSGQSKPATSPKVGRNDPCPCGSGKKYKKCCGK